MNKRTFIKLAGRIALASLAFPRFVFGQQFGFSIPDYDGGGNPYGSYGYGCYDSYGDCSPYDAYNCYGPYECTPYEPYGGYDCYSYDGYGGESYGYCYGYGVSDLFSSARPQTERVFRRG